MLVSIYILNPLEPLDFPGLTIPLNRAQEGHAYILREKVEILLKSRSLLIMGSSIEKPRNTGNVFHLGTFLPQNPQLTVDS